VIALAPATEFSLAATLCKLLAEVLSKTFATCHLASSNPSMQGFWFPYDIIVSCPHMQTAWYAACLICWMRAACDVGVEGVGGESYDLFSVALEISCIIK
jgi:hypothetical protein